MKHIKNTWHLFCLDWKRIFKHPVALLLVLALMILPSLYAWFNIKALWDPYENTSDLPIAVYSNDVGGSFGDKKVEIGEEVIKNLHDNKQLGWKFVKSKKALTEGVKSGKYFAGIYLPEEFSEDLLSFTSGEIQKPKIEYYVNQKINAVAPKITDKGAASIQSTITSEFINTASSTLVSVFNEIGVQLDSNLVSITKITSLIKEANTHKDEIKKYADEVVALNGKMPEIKEKLTLANEFIAYLPEVDELADKLVILNEKFPDIKEKASLILVLEEKIPEIENAGKQLAQVDQDFAQIETTMSEGIAEAKTGLTVIQGVQKALPDIQTLMQNTSDAVNLGEDAVTQLQNDLPANLDQIINTVVKVLQVTTLNIQQISDNLANLATEDNQQALLDALAPINSLVSAQIKALENIDNLLAYLEKGDDSLANIRKIVQNAKSNLTVLQTRLSQITTQVQQGNMAEAQSNLKALANFAGEISNSLGEINGSQVAEKIKTALSKTLTTLQAADRLLTQAQALDLDKFLQATEKTISDAVTMLEKYQKELPALKQEISDANALLNGHMAEIIAAIHTGADLYRNELPTLETRLGQAATFVKEDWPGIKEDLTKTLTMVNEKFPAVEKAVSTASDLIESDWPTLEKGLEKAAKAIDKAEENVDLTELIALLKLDAQKESDFFTSPVELITNPIYPVPNNGSASTPFYTALCLWVGALLLSSVASTDIYLKEEDKDKFSPREKFSARMMSFLVISLFQGLIVSLGNLFLLKVYAVSPGYTVSFALLVALTFMMMVYVLAALFGNIGKGIAIIILVLSISGGGGNYPIELSGKFFQFINPLLPFTHAVNLLREPVGGIYWPNATGNIFVLIGLFISFWLLGTLLYPSVSRLSKKLAEHSHRAHFFH